MQAVYSEFFHIIYNKQTDFVDAHFTQSHRHAHRVPEEIVSLVNRLFRNLVRRQFGRNAINVHTELHKTFQRAVVQDVSHPSRCDDGKPFTVRDVVVGR